jgi:hypothetical protein
MEEAERTIELSRVGVRLIVPEERARWDELMREHHYLGLNALVGRSLRYVAQYESRWLALVGWASAALKCGPRDAWIGWSAALQWQRLRLIANNSRFLLLPGPRVKNLASRILGLNLARLSEDWQRVHGHRVLLAETFIDPSRFAGTCYRAANWLELGATRGFAKSNRTYVAHGAAKRIWLFALHPRAAQMLSGAWPHPDLPRLEIKPMMTLTDAAAAELLTRIGRIEDPRARRGRRHTQRSVLACILCAVVSGAKGSTEIGEWIERMTPAMLRQLRCRRNAAGQYERPSESTVRRLLQKMPIESLENALGGWLQTQVAARTALNNEVKKNTPRSRWTAKPCAAPMTE